MSNRVLFLALCLLGSVTLHADPVLVDLQDKHIPWSSLEGKWVIINYWASWCESCLREVDELNHFYRDSRQKVALFAVNKDAVSVTSQRRLTQQFRLHYPGLKEDPAEILRLGDIRGIPATFVFSPHGELVATRFGPQTAVQLRHLIDAHLLEPK